MTCDLCEAGLSEWEKVKQAGNMSQAIHPIPYVAITDIIQSPRGTSAASVEGVATSVDMICPDSLPRSSIKI